MYKSIHLLKKFINFPLKHIKFYFFRREIGLNRLIHNVILVINMVRKNTMTIKAVKRGNGYRLVDDNNKLLPQTNEVFKTKSDAYYACSKMWPSNSVWHGKKVSSGYKIDLD